MTAHAFALIDSYVFGFALSEAALPINGPETVTEVAESMMQLFAADAYPHLVEFSTEHILKPGYDFGNEFEFGLDLILDALARSIPAVGQCANPMDPAFSGTQPSESPIHRVPGNARLVAMTDLIALTRSEVHAWHGRTGERSSVPGEPRESDLAILSADERSRCGRFIRQADRARFAAAHAAVRRLLSCYLRAGPAGIRFGRTPCCECGSTEHGPPRIDWPPTDITCNLSGSGDHWLLAVTRGRRVGVDIEVPRDVDTGQLALVCLTVAEQQYLSAHREDEQLDVFYRCWTRKEAVLKACGVGLSSSLRELEVAPGRAGPVEVRHSCKAARTAG